MANAMNAAPTTQMELDLESARHGTASQEHRSVANMIAVMIRDYCGRVPASMAHDSGLELIEAD